MTKVTAFTLALATTVLPAFSTMALAATPEDAATQINKVEKLVAPRVAAEDAPTLEWVDATQKPRVVLLCIHGLGLHKGNYAAFGKDTSKYGIATYAMDCRGFGEYLESGRHKDVDFDGTMADIKLKLQQLHQKYPGLPVVILGESMGGAVALRTAALYPDLISGCVSSVPAGDRFGELGQNFKVGMHVLTGGMHKPLNIGNSIVKHATQKDDLRHEWEDDPLGKMELTPSELMHFQKFMAENFAAARMVQDMPVLFIQGVSDKLVRPAGTWKLCDSLTTPNREMVLSKTGEHLIFEEGQFTANDLLFLRKWIDRNVAKLDTAAIAVANGTPATGRLATITATTAMPISDDTTGDSSSKNDTPIAVDPTLFTTPANKATQTGSQGNSHDTSRTGTATKTNSQLSKVNPNTTKIASVAGNTTSIDVSAEQGLSYWIELFRGGKTFRCNNKLQFKSGDAIRFHMIPKKDGFAYVLMKQGTSGKKAVLFPTANDTNNLVKAGHDYALPRRDWLTFDNHPGVEKVSLVFSRTKMAAGAVTDLNNVVTAYVSSSQTGSKDLVPTRMKLSWDDPAPVIMPDMGGGYFMGSGSAVHLTGNGSEGVMAVDVALEHD